MTWTPVCKLRNLMEGEAIPFRVEGREIMMTWPEGGELKAFSGLCPHQNIPFYEGRFNGRHLICTAHDWVFDGRNGECVRGEPCTLQEFPIRVSEEMVEIELG